MILILDCTNQDIPLLREEFVKPVHNIVRIAGYETTILPLGTRSLPQETKAVILTGTALKDHTYRTTGLPLDLLSGALPTLGICAGMQLIALSCGGRLIQNETIGMTEITAVTHYPVFSGRERFNAWEMHQSGVEVDGECEIIATSVSGVQGIKLRQKPWYGFLFHPEVRNEWLILSFLREYAHTADITSPSDTIL